MSDEQIILFLSDAKISQLLERTILRPAGYEVSLVQDSAGLETLLRAQLPYLVILGDQIYQESTDPPSTQNSLDLAASLLERYPTLPIILLASQQSDTLALEALKVGCVDYLLPPIRANQVLQAVRRAIQRRQHLDEWAQLESKRNTQSLQKRLSELEALHGIGRTLTALLDLDSVLAAVVDSAVELTGAEEGSLLLLDEASGELYMRAARNFQDDFVRTFRMPVQDTLPGQVLRTGQPLLIDETTPQKIKTAYLVSTLMYVPLQIGDRSIGVLGVDNRRSGHPFSEYHLTLVSSLADYAAIAIENAHLYAHSEIERKKLETVLTNIKDGVIVVDQDERLLLVNHAAREAFGLDASELAGKPVRAVIHHPDFLEILGMEDAPNFRSEITLEDGRVLNALSTPIHGVGLAVTMQEITHLKELDRIKSDFVSTVSHDLRSPLTAILGYVELIERAGPVNAQQREFIHRVHLSVNSITALINDLLDLGRIEAGFDTRKEIVPLSAIIQYTVDGLRDRAAAKSQELVVDTSTDLPQLLGNPLRLRQMLGNLIGNALKYTPAGGTIRISAHAEDGQMIIQVSDNGPGIPLNDQPFIFDKFYRANNVPEGTPGTGLGLAIVKSIVENHQGRIWVNSTLGQGSIFTVVLPIAEQDL